MKINSVPPIWENPEIQGYNRLPMRSPLLPFASAEAAIAEAVAGPEFPALGENPNYLSLDGLWTFKLLDNPAEDYRQERAGKESPGLTGFEVPSWALPSFKPVTTGGLGDNRIDGAWAEIKTPGAWARQGYDKPHYTNVQMPFQALPPTPPEANPTGLYRRSFVLPRNWKGRRTVLHIGSAESCCIVYINGIFAGAGKDTRLPSEYDITPYVQEGENLVCLKVVRYSDASYVEDQDQWWYGGIHRSVFLYSTAGCYLKDLRAYPGAYDATGGRLDLAVTLGGELPESRSTGNEPSPLDAGSPFVIEYAVYPFELPSSRAGAEAFAAKALKEAPLAAGRLEFTPSFRENAHTAHAAINVAKPKIWSHEHPNLYVLSVSLSRDSRHIESAAFLTAFRTVKIANRELLINGKMVYIKGVNRHEHDEKTGKTLTTEAMKKDIALLKTHNFNAVRTCHYPDDERWYDLCDRYGIYLVDEANVESHAFYNQLCREQEWSYAFAARIQRMVERDKNHPSVIIWSLGNESGSGENHAMMTAWIHHVDPARPVNYEGAVSGRTTDNLNGGRNITDIVSPMYPRIELITDFVKYREDSRPLIMIEYSHAMGNSNGSLEDYWKAIENHHGLQGGFIWEWIDHGLEAFTPEGVKYWKYGGDFGDEPSDKDFIVDGLLLPDQSLKPGMTECRQVQAPVRLRPVDGKPWTFVLENRQDFSGMEGFALEWKLAHDDPVAAAGGEAGTIIAAGLVPLPELAPGGSAEITLTPPESFDLQTMRGVVYLHFEFKLNHDTPWAAAGHVVSRAGRVLKETPQEIPLLTAAVPLLSVEAAIAAGELAAAFKPSLFRAPTQNDGLKTSLSMRGDPAMEFYYRGKAMFPWLDYDLLNMRTADEKTETISWEGWEASKYTALLLSGKDAAGAFRDARLGVYTAILVQGDPAAGRPFILDMIFDLDPGLPELPRIGVTAAVRAAYDTVSWFGAGPDESYPDRMAGAFLGRYRHKVAGMETPYVMPQENGNRSLVRNFTLLNESPASGQPKALTVWCAKPMNMSVSRYTQKNMLEAMHTCDLVDTTGGPGGFFTLNIDVAQRGVGTATCGPDTRDEYRVRGGLYTMRLYIGGV
jgi:beta-galactosidase